MGLNVATSSEYEAEANRLRARIGVTIDGLRTHLTPSHIASEAASRAGIADLSWSGAFEYACKRHPLPTAVIGLGLALLTLSAARHRRRGTGVALSATLRDSFGLDSRIREQGFSGASRGKAAGVCRYRAVAGRDGSGHAVRWHRKETRGHHRPRARRIPKFVRCSNPQSRWRWRLRSRACFPAKRI